MWAMELTLVFLTGMLIGALLWATVGEYLIRLLAAHLITS
jgi:hypothetical protein